MVVIVVVVVVVVVVMVAVVVVVVAAVMIAVVVITVLVAWYVFAVVPIIAYEVHGAAAGMIFGAVLCPMSFMPGGHVQIHWLINERSIPVNHYGARIHQRRALRHITEIDLPKEAGLADIDGQSDVGRHGRCSDKEPNQ